LNSFQFCPKFCTLGIPDADFKNSCSFGSYILPVNVRADDEGSKILISAQIFWALWKNPDGFFFRQFNWGSFGIFFFAL
jgi:hypothetical protein